MAKNKHLPDNVEKQFNKALFKAGEPVLFTWLGAKKYGYVTAHKKLIGVFNIRLRQMKLAIRAVFKSKDTKQVTIPDASVSKRQTALELMNLRNELKQLLMMTQRLRVQ